VKIRRFPEKENFRTRIPLYFCLALFREMSTENVDRSFPGFCPASSRKLKHSWNSGFLVFIHRHGPRDTTNGDFAGSPRKALDNVRNLLYTLNKICNAIFLGGEDTSRAHPHPDLQTTDTPYGPAFKTGFHSLVRPSKPSRGRKLNRCFGRRSR